jgi:hypothetical protein
MAMILHENFRALNMKETNFHNFFLSDQGTHMSIGTAVAAGLVVPGQEAGMLLIKGKKLTVHAAIEAGLIDEMAADYIASIDATASMENTKHMAHY